MNRVIKLSERFTEAAIDDEIVIMRVDTGEFFSLTGTAATTWRLIDGNRGRDALLAALADEYSTDEAAIAADVDDFLAQLKETGLLADS
jgi:hypothetical protein